MKRWPVWVGFAAGLLAIATGLLSGASALEGWQLAARWTARASFPLFIITFTASALCRLYPVGLTRALLRTRRYWGLGFAACFGLHLVALLANHWLRGSFPPAGPADPGFWAYGLLLAMVLTSNNAAQRRLGRWWKVVHRTGIWGFWFAFGLAPYIGDLLALEWPKADPLADPYAVACLLAAVLKVASWFKVRSG